MISQGRSDLGVRTESIFGPDAAVLRDLRIRKLYNKTKNLELLVII